MNRLLKVFKKGLIEENPLLILMIGLCSSLAVTSSIENAIGMGLAMTFVIVFAELVISLFRNLIPNSVRIPTFIIVIAAFTTIIDLSMKAYFPELSKSLGVFIPLIVVNCIILGRAEGFANKNTVPAAVADGLGMGVGFTFAMLVMATFREILGNGTWLGINLLGSGYNRQPLLIAILAPGAFILMGFILGFFNILDNRRKGGAR